MSGFLTLVPNHKYSTTSAIYRRDKFEKDHMSSEFMNKQASFTNLYYPQLVKWEKQPWYSTKA